MTQTIASPESTTAPSLSRHEGLARHTVLVDRQYLQTQAAQGSAYRLTGIRLLCFAKGQLDLVACINNKALEES